MRLIVFSPFFLFSCHVKQTQRLLGRPGGWKNRREEKEREREEEGERQGKEEESLPEEV